MPAESQVASGCSRRNSPRTSASRANAAVGSSPSGATAIRPRNRSPGHRSDGVRQLGQIGWRHSGAVVGPGRVEADLERDIEIAAALLRAPREGCDQLAAVE